MKLYKVLSIMGLWFPLIALLCSLADKVLSVRPLASPLPDPIAPLNSSLPLQPSPTPSLSAQDKASVIPFPIPTKENVFYVALNGKDSNPGTLEMPWRTIQKAADSLVAGEMVYIRDGVYSERVRPRNSGEPGSEIIYTNYPGERVTLDGREVPLLGDLAGLIEIVGQKYIRLSGLRVIHSGPFANNAAILVVNSEHITVENNTTFNTTSSGVGVWNSGEVLITGNTIEQAGVGGGQECITVAGTTEFEVRDNVVVDCQKEGIDAKDRSSSGIIDHNVVDHPKAVGIYVDAWDKSTRNITVSRNVVFDSVESSGFAIASEMGGLLTDIRLENNLAYHNYTYGIEVSACCSTNHPMDGIVLINNTLYENGVGWGGGIIQDNDQAQNVIIRNNIVSQNLTFQIAVAANVPAESVLIDHNLIDGYRGYEDEVYGEDYLEGDAGFLNPSAFDFHLTLSSSAIDQGSPINAPIADFDGDPRPMGSGYDIGADEWRGMVYLPLIQNWQMLIRDWTTLYVTLPNYPGCCGTNQSP